MRPKERSNKKKVRNKFRKKDTHSYERGIKFITVLTLTPLENLQWHTFFFKTKL